MTVFLIGYRCTGKTSVAQALARRLERPFVDTDQLVTQRAGVSIASMVAEQGWSHFRALERKALEVAAGGGPQVVATGGGIVLEGSNVTTMRRFGRVVWLQAGTDTIQARMLADAATAGNRPSLTGQGLVDEIATVLAERAPLYEKAAHVRIATDDLTVGQICDDIIKKLKDFGIEDRGQMSDNGTQQT